MMLAAASASQKDNVSFFMDSPFFANDTAGNGFSVDDIGN
jgi:hypothetical protein